MNWLNELAVGDVVYIVPGDKRFDRPHHAKVVRKGRKYIYLSRYYPEDGKISSHEVKADLTDSHHVRTSINVGSGASIYRSIQAYAEKVLMTKISRRIEEMFRYGPKPTDEQVKQIAAILNINGEDDVTD